MEEGKGRIQFSDFKRIELVVGRVVEAFPHPNADKLLVLKVDIKEKIITLVAGIRSSYKEEDILNKKIVVVENLEPRPLRGILSEGMLLAASSEGSLSVLTLDKDIPEGSRIS